MNINDYSTRYQEAKKDFNTENRKQKDRYDRDLKNIQKDNQVRREQIKKDYQTNLQDNVNNANRRIEKIGQNNFEKSRQTKYQFKNDLLDQTENFGKERVENRNKFKSQLDTLEHAFNGSSKANKERYQADIDYLDNYYKTLETQRRQEAAQSQKKFFNDVEKSQLDLNLHHKDEIQGLNRLHAQDKHEQSERHTGDMRYNNKQNREDYLALKDSHGLEITRREDQSIRKIKELNAARENQQAELVQSFENNVDNMTRRNQQSEQRTIEAFKKDRTETERFNAKTKSDLKRQISDYREQTDGGGYGGLMKRDTERNRERNLRTIKKSMEDRDLAHAKQVEDLRNNFSDTTFEQKRNYGKEKKQVVQEANARYAKEISKLHGQKDERYDQYETKIKNQDNKYWKDTYKLKKEGDSRVASRDEAYAESVRRMTVDKASSIEDLQEGYAAEKKIFLKDQYRQNNERVIEVRQTLKKDLNDTEKRYKDIIAQKDTKIAQLETRHENSVKYLRDKMSKEMELQRQSAGELRLEDQKNANIVMKRAYKENDDRIKEVRRRLEGKMVEMDTTNEIRMSKVQNDFDNRLKRLNSQKDIERRVEVTRVKNQVNAERLAYESKIEAMKENYEKKILDLQQRFRVEKERQNPSDIS
ncbi:hypothetical protein N9O57_00105 [bacterium]|nr:hypothetical protein [bacterium]